jgi:hypothetical protein
MPSGTDIGFSLPLDSTTVVCLGLGIVIVTLVSTKKFDESTVAEEEDDFIAQLLPKYLATRGEYSRALIRYVGSMIGILCALSAVGPRLLEILSPNLSSYTPVAPLGFALVLVGLMPSVPWLKDIEWRIRRFWHERAYIPAAARATADTLRASNFDFSAYMRTGVRASASMRGIEPADFEAPRGTIEYGWARLSCLSYELGRRRDVGETEFLDGEMLDRYASDIDNIASKRQALEADVAQYRQEKARNPFYDNKELGNAITIALRRLYVLLGCAVRLKASPSADINTTFRSFGFILGPSAPPPGNQDMIIVGLTFMSVALLILVFAAVFGGAIGLWQPSQNFPRKAFEPFMWALSALVVQGVAILTADWMRTHLLRKEQWFAVLGRERQSITANYIRVGLCCAITGYVALYLWGLIFQPPTIGLAVGTAPYALLPAMTGAFYGYHLDNVELGQRPLRIWEICSQTLATAFCGLIAAPVWLALGGNVAGNADFMTLVALMGAVVGASLAWYLPKAAADRRQNPLVEAQIKRLATLRAAALARFGSEELAEQWLVEPHPALDKLSPKDAATNIEIYAKALGLLQGPIALAA